MAPLRTYMIGVQGSDKDRENMNGTKIFNCRTCSTPKHSMSTYAIWFNLRTLSEPTHSILIIEISRMLIDKVRTVYVVYCILMHRWYLDIFKLHVMSEYYTQWQNYKSWFNIISDIISAKMRRDYAFKHGIEKKEIEGVKAVLTLK